MREPSDAEPVSDADRARYRARWRTAKHPPVRDPKGDRRKVAKFLAERGPIWGDAAAAELGMSADKWWKTVGGCRWFTLARGGWVLTEGGRAEALGGSKK